MRADSVLRAGRLVAQLAGGKDRCGQKRYGTSWNVPCLARSKEFGQDFLDFIFGLAVRANPWRIQKDLHCFKVRFLCTERQLYKSNAHHIQTNQTMVHKQGSFSSLVVVATNCDLIPSCEDSIEVNHHRNTSDKDDYAPVNFISSEILSMISAWEACNLSSTRDHQENGDSDQTNLVRSSDMEFEPLRRMPTTILEADLSPPARFRRSSKRLSGAISQTGRAS